VQIPEGKVHARVENGWVTLDGEVDYAYQKREVERMVNHVHGVAGVRNFITVRPPASPEAVDAAIEQAFKREAEVDARHVKVEVTDHTAKLYGHVHSMREASAAAAACASPTASCPGTSRPRWCRRPRSPTRRRCYPPDRHVVSGPLPLLRRRPPAGRSRPIPLTDPGLEKAGRCRIPHLDSPARWDKEPGQPSGRGMRPDGAPVRLERRRARGGAAGGDDRFASPGAVPVRRAERP
jgi:hypothetical protein